MQLALLTSTPESDPLITQFCTLDAIQDEGTTPATRFDLDRWMKTLPQPWTAAMEATVFTGWIYDLGKWTCFREWIVSAEYAEVVLQPDLPCED
jgi:hypothetical protein